MSGTQVQDQILEQKMLLVPLSLRELREFQELSAGSRGQRLTYIFLYSYTHSREKQIDRLKFCFPSQSLFNVSIKQSLFVHENKPIWLFHYLALTKVPSCHISSASSWLLQHQ